ncbi:MAG: hypothetical protein R2875_03410 [Desulfobacterales bacterium]
MKFPRISGIIYGNRSGAINKELGESDDRLIKSTEYQKQIKKPNFPKRAAKEADKQLVPPGNRCIRILLRSIGDPDLSGLDSGLGSGAKQPKTKLTFQRPKKTPGQTPLRLEKIKDRIP